MILDTKMDTTLYLDTKMDTDFYLNPPLNPFLLAPPNLDIYAVSILISEMIMNSSGFSIDLDY